MNHPRAIRAFLNLTSIGLAALALSCGGGGGGGTPAPPAAPVATSLTTSDANPAFGATFTLTPVYSAGAGTLSNGVVCPASGVASAPISANWSGARTYTLTVTNVANVTATKSVVVTPQTVVVGDISPAATTRAVSTSTTFSTTVTGGALNTVTWSASEGSFVGDVWTAPPTAGSVTITATSVDDPTKTATTTVTVEAVPPPIATSLVASTTTPAFGATFTLTPTYANGIGAIDNGVTCPATTLASAPITANWTTGARTFTLTVTNALGATDTKSVVVTPQTVAVGAISPATPTKTVNSTTPFSATVTGGALNTVTWTASAGSFVGDVWTAPATAGSVTITATSVDDPTKTATTTVTVVGVPVATSLVASSATPAFGATFTLTPTYSGGTGAIDNGVTCPASGASVNVTANWAGTRTFTLTVTNAAGLPATTTVDVTPQVVAVGAISPATPTKTVNSTTPFSATVTGGALNTVTWTASAGSFVGDVWTAPATAGSVTITATSVDDPTKTATTTVTVVGVPVATSLVASSATPAFGATFTLTPTYSGGTGAIDNGVTCPASGASVNVTANWAGTRTFTLTVTNAAGLPATTTVDVTPQVVAVGAISPATPTKTVNSTTPFSATVTGGALNTVTWTASAGSFVGDVWTAPATAGSVTITATSVDDPTKTATTTVTVVGVPVATSLVASSATPAFGATFTLTPTYSGGTGAIDNGVTCPASGASVNVTANWAGTRTFTLTVTNAAGLPATTTVDVTPQTVAVAAISPTAITRTVNTSTAFTTTVTGGALNTVTWTSTAGTWVGNVWTAPATAEVVTITATSNDDSSKTATTTVTLEPAAIITSFTATATTVAAGTNVTLTPVFTGVAGTLNQGLGTATSGTPVGPIPVNATTTFTLTVTNVLGDSVSRSVTVYVIVPGAFTATGNMATARSAPTATLLADNTSVLIVGGASNGSRATAEIYSGGTCTPTGSMAVGRYSHVATRLTDGKVLITGGFNSAAAPGSQVLATAEIYNPADGSFTPTTGTMNAARMDHTATLLSNGLVLVAGGTDNDTIKGAELFDPTTGLFTALTGPNAWPAPRTRATHTATLLNDGRVLLAGGYNGAVWGTADVYDSVANTFTAVGDMGLIRWGHTATLLPDGSVFFAGGRIGTELAGSVTDVAEIYTPGPDPGLPPSGNFSPVGPSMTTAREWHVATLLPNGNVLIAGGDQDDGGVIANPEINLQSAEIYDPMAGTFTATGNMTVPRINFTATVIPATGYVLIVGGGATQVTELYQ